MQCNVTKNFAVLRTYSDRHCTWHDDQLANSHYARNCSSSQSQPRSQPRRLSPGQGGHLSLPPWIPSPPCSPLLLSQSHTLRCSGPGRRRRCTVLHPRFPFLICHEAGERESGEKGKMPKPRLQAEAGGQFSQSEHESFFGQRQTTYPELCIPNRGK